MSRNRTPAALPTRNRVLEGLRGGDCRSIGKSAEITVAVSKAPALFGELFEGLLDADPIIRMRAADAIEKVTRKHPALLQPWKRPLLDVISVVQQKEVRWHVAQMLPRLSLRPDERRKAVRILFDYLRDASSIVRTFSMQALVELSERDARLRPRIKLLVEQLARTGTPAMKSRGRKLLRSMRSPE